MAKIYGHSNFAGPREELKRALENPTRVSDSWGLREKPKPEKAPSSESSVGKEA